MILIIKESKLKNTTLTNKEREREKTILNQ